MNRPQETMKGWTLRALCPVCLMVVALGAAGSALAQAAGPGEAPQNPADLISTGTPPDLSPAAEPEPAGVPASDASGGGHQPAAPIEARTAPPPERPSLAALLEPLWVDLTDAQQTALAPFAPEWNTWPMAEKKSWVALADKLPAMSAERRAKAQRRILEWANLSPEQRRLARANYRLAKERSMEQRVEEWQSYQSMTQEQREILRRAGSTSNTAAGHAGAATGLAKEASQPLPRVATPPARGNAFIPAARPGP
jgi:hypothetical protein